MTPTEARSALKEGDGAGVRIAVLDSGIDGQHPALGGLELAHDLAVSSRGGRLSIEPGCGDVFGHGTAVAGIILKGAPKATLGSFRVLGHFKESRAEVIREGVKHAARLGYHILQCSFGAPARGPHLATYKSWIDAVYMRGIHIVAAGSNSGFQTLEWPACFPTVIAVGADPRDRDYLSRSDGSMVEFAISGNEADALWPGGGTRDVFGSSFSAPKVAAQLARILSVCPDMSPLTAKALLLEIAKERAD